MSKAIFNFYKWIDQQEIPLTGQFIAEELDVANADWKLARLTDNIRIMIEPEDIIKVTDAKSVIKLFEEYDLSVGTNPLECLE